MSFNLDTFLPYQFSLVTNTISQSLAREYAPFNITRTQWRILAVLGSVGDMTAQEISNKTMMDKTTLSRAIKNMVERKLVKRQA
ncbi:MAG: MarR family transcriptional regulator, partial [Robiginitomaculum sp.]|nr:MarR family transcriptional regulator [Robiginitomaculum sp.]